MPHLEAADKEVPTKYEVCQLPSEGAQTSRRKFERASPRCVNAKTTDLGVIKQDSLLKTRWEKVWKCEICSKHRLVSSRSDVVANPRYHTPKHDQTPDMIWLPKNSDFFVAKSAFRVK